MKQILVQVLLLLIFAHHGWAEMIGIASVEWLTCDSDVIVIGKVAEITRAESLYSTVFEDCKIQIDEVIKGGISGTELVFCWGAVPNQPEPQGFLQSDSSILFFLSRSDVRKENHHLHDMLVLTSKSFPTSAVNLANLPEEIYDRNATPLRDSKQIVSLTKSWADREVRYSLMGDRLPPKEPSGIDGGGGRWLIIPVEEKYRAQFVADAQSDDPGRRWWAARELYKFPGEETERILRGLLKDETEQVMSPSADTISRVQYGVRTAAYESLQILGKPVPEIQLWRRATEEEQRSIRQDYWRRAFTEGLSDGWRVISLEDGTTRVLNELESTVVVVTVGKDDLRCKFTLIPYEWNLEISSEGENLGRAPGQLGRVFYFDGELPSPVQKNLIKYFGLEALLEGLGDR